MAINLGQCTVTLIISHEPPTPVSKASFAVDSSPEILFELYRTGFE